MAPQVNIRELRINRGLSLEEAAKEIGVGSSALANAEEGNARPHPRNAFKIASFYGHKVTDIWPLEEQPQAKATTA